MGAISEYIIPFLFLLLFAFAAGKRVNAFDTFIDGSKKSLQIAASIFPFFVTIFFAVQLFRISGAAEHLGKFLSPAFSVLGIPKEIIELVILRPFSGSGSIALANEIFKNYGPDSYAGRCASILMGSTDTVFYVITIYFSGTSVKKLRYAIPLGLLICIIGAVVACFVCRIFY